MAIKNLAELTRNEIKNITKINEEKITAIAAPKISYSDAIKQNKKQDTKNETETAIIKVYKTEEFVEKCKKVINPIKIKTRITWLKKFNANTVLLGAPTREQLKAYTHKVSEHFKDVKISENKNKDFYT